MVLSAAQMVEASGTVSSAGKIAPSESVGENVRGFIGQGEAGVRPATNTYLTDLTKAGIVEQMKRVRRVCDFCGDDLVLGQDWSKFRSSKGNTFTVHARVLLRGSPPSAVDCQAGLLENMGQLDNG